MVDQQLRKPIERCLHIAERDLMSVFCYIEANCSFEFGESDAVLAASGQETSKTFLAQMLSCGSRMILGHGGEVEWLIVMLRSECYTLLHRMRQRSTKMTASRSSAHAMIR